MKASKSKFVVFLCLAGMVAIHAAVFWSLREPVRKGYSDFTIYYCAGTILRQGLGHQLYDNATQFRVQREFAPQVAIRLDALPYNHPPFEAVLFIPFTYLSYPSAFALWDLANLALLALLPFLLRLHLPQLQSYPWPLWVLATLAFFPIFVALLQGQDAILLLFLYALAYVCLKKNLDAFAGGVLALGLFKPHLVLPIVFLLFVQGRKKILCGFVPIAAMLVLVSVAIVGAAGIVPYLHYVMHLEDTLAKGAIVRSDMPNLRGALDMLLSDSPHEVVAVLVISLGLLLFSAWESRKVGQNNVFDLQFSLAAIATVLVSYHALIYDLSVLMVPVLLIANELLDKAEVRAGRSVLIITAMAIFFFAPLQLLLMRGHYAALLAWALLLWWSGITKEISLRTTSGAQVQGGR